MRYLPTQMQHCCTVLLVPEWCRFTQFSILRILLEMKGGVNPKYTFVETCFPSLILSFPPLPARETQEKKGEFRVTNGSRCRHRRVSPAPPPHFVFAPSTTTSTTTTLPSPPPTLPLAAVCGRKRPEWAKPSGSHLELGWTSQISVFFV